MAGYGSIGRIKRWTGSQPPPGILGRMRYISGGPTAQPQGVGGAGVGSGGGLPEEIHRQRQEAEKKADKQYQETKATIDAAYEAGLMTDSEYQNLLTESRETIESQTSDLMRRTTEGAYGQVNIGALRGGLRDIEKSRIGQLAKSSRDIGFERAGRRVTAAKEKARGYTDMMRIREIPRFDIPAGFSRGEAYSAMTGQPGGGYGSPTRVVGGAGGGMGGGGRTITSFRSSSTPKSHSASAWSARSRASSAQIKAQQAAATKKRGY